MKILWTAMRPQQWLKNLFLFIPVVFGKKLFDPLVVGMALEAFLLFCLTASAVYILNDLKDAPKDRLHPVKRLRPIASGAFSARAALTCAAILAASSILLAVTLNVRFGMVLSVYFAANILYTKILKDIVIIDVFMISLFFFLRVLAGTVIADVAFSHWMLFMILLLALFLGFNKRRQELQFNAADHIEDQRFVLGKYNVYFIDQMISALTSAILIVYMLYTVDQTTVEKFGTRHLIYTIPFVCYGIFRYLYMVYKRNQGEDPTILLLRDRMTQLNVLLWIACCVVIIYFHF